MSAPGSATEELTAEDRRTLELIAAAPRDIDDENAATARMLQLYDAVLAELANAELRIASRIELEVLAPMREERDAYAADAAAAAARARAVTPERCDECDPSFGCFSEPAKCSKRPVTPEGDGNAEPAWDGRWSPLDPLDSEIFPQAPCKDCLLKGAHDPLCRQVRLKAECDAEVLARIRNIVATKTVEADRCCDGGWRARIQSMAFESIREALRPTTSRSGNDG